MVYAIPDVTHKGDDMGVDGVVEMGQDIVDNSSWRSGCRCSATRWTR